MQQALTHPSFRMNYGTNADHARNSLTNCGKRQLEYGDKRIHYLHTRKRGKLFAIVLNIVTHLHLVLRRCWLGSRKGIRPVINWVVGCWHGYLSGLRCRFAYGPVKSRLVLTRVILTKSRGLSGVKGGREVKKAKTWYFMWSYRIYEVIMNKRKNSFNGMMLTVSTLVRIK